MELVSLLSLGENTSEFKKFKYYFFKALISFLKISYRLGLFIYKILTIVLRLLFIAPELYLKISPTKNELIKRTNRNLFL